MTGGTAGTGLPVQRSEKLVSIQLLRIIAAATVALYHQAIGFADHVGGGLQAFPLTARTGDSAVMLFFLISGYIMVVSSRSLFGEARARQVFWTRRAVRILPPYWFATLLLVAIMLVLQGQAVSTGDLARSLVLWPYMSTPASVEPLPLLWVGWTLFYEMLFYFLFGLFVTRPRGQALAGTAAALGLLVLLGNFVPVDFVAISAATRPVLLAFVGGMALGYWREQGHAASAWLRWLALGAAIAAWLLIERSSEASPHGLDDLVWAGLPALLIAIAVAGGPLTLPAPHFVNRLGDISYALYLLHVPAAHCWIWVRAQTGPIGGSWTFLVTLFAGTLVASWLFFLLVERPLTRWLNVRLGTARRGDGLLQQTGV